MRVIMREFAVQEAHNRQAYGRFTIVVRMLKNWRARRAVNALRHLDDYMLRDIGLTRDDLRKMMAVPLSTDMQWESERLNLIASREKR
jgi:uncharacterized protein YjiS (DUF1127 family)